MGQNADQESPSGVEIRKDRFAPRFLCDSRHRTGQGVTMQEPVSLGALHAPTQFRLFR
jgi:hypothetical protein